MTDDTAESTIRPGQAPGTRNGTKLQIEAQIEDQGREVVERAIELALAGDRGALSLCIERIAPRGMDRPVPFALPRVERLQDVPAAAAQIAPALGDGTLSPREATELLEVLRYLTQAFAAADDLDRAREQLKSSRKIMVMRWRTPGEAPGKDEQARKKKPGGDGPGGRLQ